MQTACESPHRSSYPQVFAPLLVGAVILGIYLLSPIKQTGSDSQWTIYLAESLIHEGNLDLDEYRSVISADDYRVRAIGGHIQSYFPVGTALVAVPFVFVDNAIDPALRDNLESRYAAVEQAIAAIITAVTCVLIFLIVRRSLSLRGALLITAIFAFGTAAWSTTSRALWQHGPSMLALTIALYIVFLSRERPGLIQFAGIPLAFAYVIRPTNSISLVLFSLFVLLYYRRYLLGYLFGVTVILALFVGYSHITYQTILPPYYLPGRLHNRTMIEALAGIVVSPSRGLFVFSPILMVAFCGFYVTLRSRASDRWNVRLASLLLAAVILHWIAISAFPHWWGGASYGPRLFSDVLPYLVVLMIPAVDRLSVSRSAPAGVLVGVLIVISLAINGRGAISAEANRWNTFPVDVDQIPARVWDAWDAQFLRGIPFLDPLIPPRMAAGAAQIDLLAETGAQSVASWGLQLYDLRGRGVRWAIQPLPGIAFSATTGSGAQPETITLSVPTAGLIAGVHDLGPIVVVASRIADPFSRTDMLSIPVRLVIGDIGRVYLPCVLR